MKRTLLRVYDKNEKYTNNGECYFLILPENYDNNNNYHYVEYIYPNLCAISGMQWQNYTSYLIGNAEIEEDEMFWSEITGYILKECKIDIKRVSIIGKYKLPIEMTWKQQF